MKNILPVFILFIISCSEVNEEPDCTGIIGGDSICGCMDSSALNFLSDATIDDGSCEYGSEPNDTTSADTMFGCMDSTAANYDSSVFIDDSSCAYSIQKLIWKTQGSSKTEFEIIRDGLQYEIIVAEFDGDSLNVVGNVSQGDVDIYQIIEGIFTGYYDLEYFSNSSGITSEFWTTLTLVYETNWSQSYNSISPDFPISEIYFYVESRAQDWCPGDYYSIENECYHKGDISILQELVGNYAPSVLTMMSEPEWQDGRLIHFICDGCILQGALPSSIGNLTALRELIISNSLLSGVIPESLLTLGQLHALILSNNQLSGTVPETICNLDIENIIIDLEQNQLCPPYPDCIEEMMGEQDTSQCDEG